MNDPVVMNHPSPGMPGPENVTVERAAYRLVWYPLGWRSDDDPEWDGTPPAEPLPVPVRTVGNQTIGGQKTFTVSPVVPNPAAGPTSAVSRAEAETIAAEGGGGVGPQAEATLLGREDGAGTGTPDPLTPTQVKAFLTYEGTEVANTPSGTLTATDVQGAIDELDATVAGLPELVAGDPTELDVDVVGGVATLSLEDTIARNLFPRTPGHYYVNASDQWNNQGLTVNRVFYFPVILPAGAVDRIGVEVTVAQPSGVIRLGVYLDNGAGLPGNLIAEATSTADGSITGVKDLTIAATIPKNGLYWLAVVGQGSGSSISVQGFSRGGWLGVSQGTSPPSGTTASWRAVPQNGVTGALPATATPDTSGGGLGVRVHFRWA